MKIGLFFSFIYFLFQKIKKLKIKISYFLSLTFPNLEQAIPILPEISEGIDALELRVDLLESWDKNFIKDQVI